MKGTVKQVLVVGTRGLRSAGLDSIERQSQFLVAKIAALEQHGIVKPDDKLLLVSHSMGGLAAHGATFLMENATSSRSAKP